jgi:hydrogenase nickel incorporation protein HypA/HybF
MHEYSVVVELVEALLPRLEGHEGQVTAVYLKKGDLRILSDRALKNAFEVVIQGTRLEGATLEIESIPARIACRTCTYEGLAEVFRDEGAHFAVPILSCPKCEGDVDIRSGRELSVDRVSIRSEAAEKA